MSEPVKVKVICQLGYITLHVGKLKIPLSAERARELAQLLQEAADVDESMGGAGKP
jgi:hypothetical protein